MKTDAGTVEVPEDLRRVVAAIGSFETDMVAVGVMPVLTISFAGPWVELDDAVTITENVPPTAEELVAVRPDLLVGWSWVTKEESFDEISKVVPYVGLGESAATAGPGFDGSQPLRSWDTLFLSVCEAINRRGRGEEMVAEFDQRLDDLAERRRGEPPVSVARIEFYEPGSFSYRGTNEDTAELMRRIGLTVVGPEDLVQSGEPGASPPHRRRRARHPRRQRQHPPRPLRRDRRHRALPVDPSGQGGQRASRRRRPAARARAPVGTSARGRPRAPLPQRLTRPCTEQSNTSNL